MYGKYLAVCCQSTFNLMFQYSWRLKVVTFFFLFISGQNVVIPVFHPKSLKVLCCLVSTAPQKNHVF